nr:hypothetical protein CFP56_03041 [Quercus suber]
MLWNTTTSSASTPENAARACAAVNPASTSRRIVHDEAAQQRQHARLRDGRAQGQRVCAAGAGVRPQQQPGQRGEQRRVREEGVGGVEQALRFAVDLAVRLQQVGRERAGGRVRVLRQEEDVDLRAQFRGQGEERGDGGGWGGHGSWFGFERGGGFWED